MKPILILLVMVGLFSSACGPDLSAYEYLKNPEIVRLPAQKMLTAHCSGDMDLMGAVVGKMYFMFGQLKSNDMSMKPPIARWIIPSIDVKTNWTAIWALPIGEGVSSLPMASEKIDSLQVEYKIETWYGGEFAQILHIGAYEAETPTIERLKEYIQEKGYEITGMHEEEYLRGPDMFGKGDPKNYWTIIRYGVSPVQR